MLHLRGYDIKEADYRAYVHGIIQSPTLAKFICENAKTDDERAQKLVHPDSGVWPLVPSGGTVQPSRDAVYEDAVRAVQILMMQFIDPSLRLLGLIIATVTQLGDTCKQSG